MTQNIDIKLLYQHVEPAELKGSICVVADILRATTSIVHGLGHGAARVIPCETVEEAKNRAKHFPSEQILLGGERHGQLIDGFQLDNSPWSYTSTNIAGKTIIFTTTNGTQAIARCSLAARVFIGAFSNFTSLVQLLHTATLPIHIICAGTDGKISLEDVLFAGMLVQELSSASDVQVLKDDETVLATSLFESVGPSEESRLETFKISRGGKNLLELGMFRDLERAASMDLYDIVPEWKAANGEITAVSGTF